MRERARVIHPPPLEDLVAAALQGYPRPSGPAEAALVATTSQKIHEHARSLWAEGPLPHDRVDWFCRMFARLAVTNPSLVLFRPSAALENGFVVLRGMTNTPSIIEGVMEALGDVGIEHVRDEMRVLPDAERLGDRRFGACQHSLALTFAEPGEQGKEQTQLLFGEPVFLLDREGGDYLLHSGDGYWGWVRQDAIHAMTDEEFQQYSAHTQAVVLDDIDLGSVRIFRGARVAVDGENVGGRLTLVWPDGRRSPLPASKLRSESAVQKEAAEARVRAALDLRSTPYLFGGRSPLGLDCSGLVSSACARTGLVLARDAWQQAFAGSLVATRWHRKGLRAGDLVFFIDASGKIHHTGVAVSPTHLVHASPPCVQISSLRPGDRLYDARLDRAFFMAKRP
ncbi:MAG: NlpC/P60 family protein [Planctomycetota bacterium]